MTSTSGPSVVVLACVGAAGGTAPAAAAATKAKGNKAGEALVSGALTGAVECFVCYPVEFAKTQLQLQAATTTTRHQPAATVTSAAQLQPRPSMSMTRVMRDALSSDGIRGVYRGMAPVLAGSVPKQAARWSTFEQTTAWMRERRPAKQADAATAAGGRRPSASAGASSKHGGLSMYELSLCGMVSGWSEALFAVIPSETLKTKLIATQPMSMSTAHQQQQTFWAKVRRIALEDGGVLRGLYCGVGPTMARQGINQSIRFPVQALCMSVVETSPVVSFHPKGSSSPSSSRFRFSEPTNQDVASRRRNPLWNGATGFVAGCVSTLVTQPVDVVKTKMQGRRAVDGPRTSRDWVAHVLKTDGLSGFYAGLMPRLVRVGCNVALTFSVFPIVQAAVSRSSV